MTARTCDETYLYCKIKVMERNKQGAPHGMRTGWREYQVWGSRRIISRHELYREAVKAAKAFDASLKGSQ